MGIKAEFIEKKSFRVKIRDHKVVTDLPEKMGGGDTGPTPPELLMASLGSCAGIFAVRYLETAGLNPEGLSIAIEWQFDESKTRIGRISMSIMAPNAVLGERRKALLAAVRKCVIHNTLKESPDIEIDIKSE